jgi:hypothetical protein
MSIPTRIHLEAVRLVRERKASGYREACRMIAARRKKTQPVTVREIRLPYRDD